MAGQVCGAQGVSSTWLVVGPHCPRIVVSCHRNVVHVDGTYGARRSARPHARVQHVCVCVCVCVCVHVCVHVVCCVCVCVCVLKALLPKGNGRYGLARGKMQAGRAVCLSLHALCVVCYTPGTVGQRPRIGAVLVPGCPGDALPFRLWVQLEFSQCPHRGASWPLAGLDEAVSSSSVG